MLTSRHEGRGSKRAVIAGAITIALICGPVVAAASSTSSGATVNPRVPACTSSGLVEWLDTQANGAAGTIYYKVKFTNLSGHSCTLRGYPGVSGITLGGAQLGSAASRSAGTPVKTVTLGIGKTAISALGITEVGNYSASSCHPTTAAGLRVYAPNQTAAKTIPFPFGACAKAGDLYLSIQAVKP